MKKSRVCGLFLGLAFALAGVAAGAEGRELRFGGLDLSADSRMLFRAESGDGQRAVFVSRLTDLALQQLTVFPAKMTLVEDGRTALVWNRFGAVRIPSAGGLPRPVRGFPSFASGTAPVLGRPMDLAASADGRWILFVEPTGSAYGNLMLLEVAGSGAGARRLVSERVELPARDFPARWSPDSRFFVYAKQGRLFYYSLGYLPSAPVDERFRQIGEGGINAMFWGQRGDFFYVKGNTLYLVQSPALHTRTMYGSFLSIGSVAGTIPLDFDSNFDRFWIAPDSRSMLFVKGGKNIFYYPLGDTRGGAPLPYVPIPGGALDISVLWAPSGLVTIVASPLAGGETMAWRFKTGGEAAVSFLPLDAAAPGTQCALSPDGTRVLFWGENGLAVWDYPNWRPVQDLNSEAVYSCVWLNNGELIAGDGERIERISLSGERRLVCLADAGEYGFEEGAEAAILAHSRGEWFTSDGKSPWAPAAGEPFPRAASQVSGRYRVFLEPQSSGPYENIPMIRTITPAGAASVAAAIVPARPPARIGGRIALCFDLYDDDSGLHQALDALNRFGVTATFFMNGDFIRNNPSAAAAIAGAGHEAASLFYAPIDLSDTRYRISPEFIAQGLARNEDEYFEATGRELNLIWHPPFYRGSPEISAAAAKAGYRTVERSVDPLDWMSREEARGPGLRQYSAPDMIERIMAARLPGAVIPVRLGLVPGGRDDYLFLRIETLLDALIRAGCDIVPVSALLL